MYIFKDMWFPVYKIEKSISVDVEKYEIDPDIVAEWDRVHEEFYAIQLKLIVIYEREKQLKERTK